MGSGSGRPVDAAATVEMVETSDSIWSSSLICHRQPITGRSTPLQVLVKDRAVDFMGSCTRRPIDLAIFKVLHASATDARYRILAVQWRTCLLYTSDAADDLLCVDLGGRRIIKKKT